MSFLITLIIYMTIILELVIAIIAIINLCKIDKKIIETNQTIEQLLPDIKEVAILTKGISEQIKTLIESKFEEFVEHQQDLLLEKIIKSIFMFFILKSNIKLINKLKKSKLLKIIGKGISILGFVV